MFLNSTEAEIMADWLVDEPVRVSICCITYRQEQYIKQAIDSFLMQKTTFPFEIIIGEDCGGDATLSILAEYQVKYPRLIKVITSEKNVGANTNFLRVVHAAQGKFIATCEGDDYWVDELKIQKQYESLNNESGVNLCFTAAKKLAGDGSVNSYAFHGKTKKIFSANTVIRGGGGFMPTASLMMSAEIAKTVPHWFISAPIGDFYLQILSSLSGGAIYLPDTTCVYRLEAVGSWSTQKSRLSNDDIVLQNKHNEYCLNELAKFGYRSDFDFAIAKMLHAGASLLASNRCYHLAKAEIERSWSYCQYCDSRQALMFHLKNTLWLYRFLKNYKF